MDEEVFENVVEDVVESVVENVESNEPEYTEPAPAPVPERPWKKNAPPETIPYNRFSEVISEKHKLEETLKAKEKELEEYYKTKKIVDGMDLSDIDPESQTIEEVIQKVALKVKSQVHAEHQKAEEIKRVAEIESKIADEFTKKVERASTKNAEVKDAVEYINKFAHLMPTETRYALVTDDNVGEVLFEVATTEGLLESLLKMNPIDAVRRLSKISQKYDSDSDGSALSKVTQKQVEIPKTMPRTGTPPRSTQPVKSSTKYDDNMSFSDYAKLRASGKI